MYSPLLKEYDPGVTEDKTRRKGGRHLPDANQP